jgi:hypothetical protein
LSVAAIAVGLASCFLTAGCSPQRLGTAGVVLVDGHPTVLIRPCPGIAVTQVWLQEQVTSLRWGAADSGHHAAKEMRLLQAPPTGWTVPVVAETDRLTKLSADATYQVRLTTNHEEKGRIGTVEFTLVDLGADTVWGTPPHSAIRVVLTREEFEKKAAKDC